MGIVNASPDSFSDAVRLRTLDAQVEHAPALVAAGADIIDVGGESGVTYTGDDAAGGRDRARRPARRALAAEGVAGLGRHVQAATSRAAALDAGRRDDQRRQRPARRRRSPSCARGPAPRSSSCTRGPRPSRSASPTTAATSSATSSRSSPSAAPPRARPACAPTSSSSTPGPTSPRRRPRRSRSLRAHRARSRRSAVRCCSRSRASTSSARSPAARRRERLAGTLAARRRGRPTPARPSCGCTTSPPRPTSWPCARVLAGERRARRRSTPTTTRLKWRSRPGRTRGRRRRPALARPAYRVAGRCDNAAGCPPTRPHRRTTCPS